MNAPVRPRLVTSTALTPAETKPVPQSVDLEAALLGCVLLNNETLAFVTPILKVDHLSEEVHRRIYTVAVDLVAQGKPASPLTIIGYLADTPLGIDGDGVEVTVRVYLARLVANALPPVLAAGIAKELRDLANRREMIEVGEALAASARDPNVKTTCMELLEAPLQALQRIGEVVTETETRRDPGDSAAGILARARAVMNGERRDVGVPTSLPELDRATGGGFQPGTLWIVGGRPRMGKSILGTGFARKIASRGARDIEKGLPGTGAQFFSLELPEDQIVARFLADLAYSPRRAISFGSIMSGSLDESDFWAVEEAQKRLSTLPLALDVAPALTVAEIGARVRAEKLRMARAGIRLAVVFVDYLKFIRASDRYRGNRVYEVGEISGALKQLAKAEGVCVVLLAQVNRAVDKADRKDKAPNLSDLRDSGDLEADADVVLFIDRESVRVKQSAEYKASDPDAVARFIELEHKADLIIAKTRTGSENTLSIWFDAGASTFASEARGGA